MSLTNPIYIDYLGIPGSILLAIEIHIYIYIYIYTFVFLTCYGSYGAIGAKKEISPQ